MKLSIVILNYNVRYFLELCLQSVEAATVDLDAEIIVVDNASGDESGQMVKAKFPNVILIQNHENQGFSKGNNLGVAKAKGEFVCILNPDTVVAEDIFLKLLKFTDKKENLGILGCKLIDGTGKFLPESKRNIPTPIVSIKKILGLSKTYYANQIGLNEVAEVDVLVGAFMLMKREVYNQVKGFDEDYFMYGEDVDLSFRVKKEGFHNYYIPNARIIHFKGESTLKDKKYAERFYGAMQIFYNKHFKKNRLFDLLVWFGIKFAKYFSNNSENTKTKIKDYLLVSDKSYPELAKKCQHLQTVSLLNKAKPNTEIIFDANFLAFKEIINQMDKFSLEKNITFKILPKNANFILGSNDSKTKGEVIQF